MSIQNPVSNSQRGFTLIELSMVVAIIGIITALALPYYREYVEEAHVAEALTIYHAISEESQVIAQTAGNNVCDWPGSETLSPAFKEIVTKGEARLKGLNPKLWIPSANHFLHETIPGKRAFYIQFGALGAQGVLRTHLLAMHFKKLGVFRGWERDLRSFAAFKVYLADCKI